MNVVPISYAFGSSYIKLPDRILSSKAFVNIKNINDKCFSYCHVLHERYRLTDNKIQGVERLHGEKAFIYDNKIIHIDNDGISLPLTYNDP